MSFCSWLCPWARLSQLHRLWLASCVAPRAAPHAAPPATGTCRSGSSFPEGRGPSGCCHKCLPFSLFHYGPCHTHMTWEVGSLCPVLATGPRDFYGFAVSSHLTFQANVCFVHHFGRCEKPVGALGQLSAAGTELPWLLQGPWGGCEGSTTSLAYSPQPLPIVQTVGRSGLLGFWANSKPVMSINLSQGLPFRLGSRPGLDGEAQLATRPWGLRRQRGCPR